MATGVQGNSLNINQISNAENGGAVKEADATAWVTALDNAGFDQEIIDLLNELVASGAGYDAIANFLKDYDIGDNGGAGNDILDQDDAGIINTNRIDTDWIENSSDLDMDASLDPDAKNNWLEKMVFSGLDPSGEVYLAIESAMDTENITNGETLAFLKALNRNNDNDLDAIDLNTLTVDDVTTAKEASISSTPDAAVEAQEEDEVEEAQEEDEDSSAADTDDDSADTSLSLSDLTNSDAKDMFEADKDDYIDYVLESLDKYKGEYPDALDMIEETLDAANDFDQVTNRLTLIAELGQASSDGVIGFKDLELFEDYGILNDDGTFTIDEDYEKPEEDGIVRYSEMMLSNMIKVTAETEKDEKEESEK